MKLQHNKLKLIFVHLPYNVIAKVIIDGLNHLKYQNNLLKYWDKEEKININYKFFL